VTWRYAALALDTGIPMSVLLDEPAGYVDAMYDVQEWRAEEAERQRRR
jgi:hypothetical protein